MSTYLIHPTDEQEKVVKAFLEALDISFIKEEEDELPQHVLDGIAKGKAQIAAGQYLTHEEFIKGIGLTK
jgi:predicted transcriptional regulator